MPTKLSKKGFTLVELLVAMVIILFMGIGLARGIVELIKLDMRIKARQTAQQVVESWASYIQALPFDYWVINPGEENCDDPPGTGCHALYCDYNNNNNCSNMNALCYNKRISWTNLQLGSPRKPLVCNDPNDPNCTYCSFMARIYYYDQDEDKIVNLYDPYTGNNDCATGQPAPGKDRCTEEDGNMKYRYPTWFLEGHLRLAPDWGQGSDDCACRLGNCPDERIGSPWTSWDGSFNYRIGKRYLNNLKCTYQVGKSDGVSWQSAPGNKVYVGITVINYAHLEKPNTIVGKAIGIVAWYFDPIDHRYRAYTKVVFKEKP